MGLGSTLRTPGDSKALGNKHIHGYKRFHGTQMAPFRVSSRQPNFSLCAGGGGSGGGGGGGGGGGAGAGGVGGGGGCGRTWRSGSFCVNKFACHVMFGNICPPTLGGVLDGCRRRRG